MPWPSAVMALTGRPEEPRNSGLAMVGPDPPPLMRSSHRGRSCGILARSIHELNLIRHVALVR
jgi:hypothetical protein